MSDRPIKFNPQGKYNLDFIDWQNQYQAVIEADYDGEKQPEVSPISGMDAATFHKLMLEDSIQFRLQQQDLEKQLQNMGSKGLQGIKKMKIGKSQKQCTICIKGFIKGQVIRLLSCKHIFHDKCIMPWLQKRNDCPNCRRQQK